MKNKLIISASFAILVVGFPACYRANQQADQSNLNSASAQSSNDHRQRKQIETKLNEMFEKQFGVEKERITLDARLAEDFKGDDLDLVEMILRIEDEFGIEIPDADAENLRRVRDFYDYVEKRLKEKTK